jgi:hypothetical protein
LQAASASQSSDAVGSNVDIACFFWPLFFFYVIVPANALTELAHIAGGSAKTSGGNAGRARRIRQCRSAVFYTASSVVTILLRA